MTNIAISQLRGSAAHDPSDRSVPWFVKFGMVFAEGDDAGLAAFVAAFPKSAGVHSTTLSTFEGVDWTTGRSVRLPFATVEIFLSSNRANGGRNETGVKRYQSIIRTAAKLGLKVGWDGNGSNLYDTQAAFEEALA
jgi:hypothetical protein